MIPAESILKSSTTPGSTTEARHAVRFRQDLNQSLLALLGVNRLARTSGGDLEGLVLNAQAWTSRVTAFVWSLDSWPQIFRYRNI